MKKEIFILLIILLVLPFMFNIVSADEVSDTLGVNLSQVEDTSTKLTTSWDYLSKEWKASLLKNPVIQDIDSFCQKITIVFFVLFAEDYSFSLKLLLIIIFWTYLLFLFYSVVKNYSTFSKPVSFGIAFLLTGIFAHIGAMKIPADAVIWFFFGDKAWWGKLIVGIVILVGLITIMTLVKQYGRKYKEKKQKLKDKMNSEKLESQVKAGEPLSEALSKISKE